MLLLLLLLPALVASAELSPVDQSILDLVEPMRLKSSLATFTKEPHVFGRPRSHAQALLIQKEWKATGFFDSVDVVPFKGVASYPVNLAVDIVAPAPQSLTLTEPASGPGIEFTDVLPLFNAYSASKNVTGRVLYVNYCRREDFEYLRDVLDVELTGAIALCRYGLIMRGLKGRYSEEFGAVGTLIYSDPGDDGYAQGVEFPDGPARPSFGGQRGSAAYLPWCPGSPSQERIDGVCGLKDQPVSTVLPSIPIQPLPWEQAQKVLRLLQGQPVRSEDGWQGGLPFHYHVGDAGTEVRVRLDLKFDGPKSVDGYNVVARHLGATQPNLKIVLGSHHDAWVAGAQDPTSGIAVLTEVAHVLQAARNVTGFRLARTLEFSAWDGEEWALIGSTQHVEANAKALSEECIYYLNFDGVVMSSFPSRALLLVEASPILASVVRTAAAKVPWPYAEHEHPTSISSRLFPSEGQFLVLGSGSDYVGFLDRLGISSVGMSWTNAAAASNYHSRYDSFDLVSRLADPEFLLHAASAQFVGVLAYHLASSGEVPHDVENVPTALSVYKTMFQDKFPAVTLDWSAFDSALETLENLATRVASSDTSTAHIGMLMERQSFLGPGLPGRPWYKNVLYSASLLDGYAAQPFPGVAYYARAGKTFNTTLAQQQLDIVTTSVRKAITFLNEVPLSLSSDELAGIVAGSILVVAMFITIIICICLKKKQPEGYEQV